MYDFEYQRPGDVAKAVAAASADEARFLAGGQSLIQSMRLRLASASTLVDLAGIDALRGVSTEPGGVRIGAMTRHAEVASSDEVRQTIPALAEMAATIGDPMVRNMGTLGGSIANADPAADYPAAVLALNATIQTDRRTIAADDFFVDLFTTALEPGELIKSVFFTRPEQAGYEKLRQPASRFVLVGVMVARYGAEVRVGVTGARACAYRVPEMEAALSADFRPEAVASIRLDPAGYNSDMHGSAEYRAAMVSVLAGRAVKKALSR